MTSRLAEWRERDLERRTARQRTQIETAKLLATLAVSAAAAIVASALQAGRSKPWTLLSVIILAVAFLAVVLIIMLDRMTQVNQDHIVAEAQVRGWNEDRMLQELQLAFVVSVYNNEEIVRSVRLATQLQVALSIASAVGATISLLA